MAHIDHVVSINQTDRTITQGSKVYSFPKGMQGNNITTINNKTYIDGYELVEGKWKITWKALWYLIF